MNFRFFLKQSLQNQLSVCLSAIVLLIAIVTAYISYLAELEDALEAQNHHLTHFFTRDLALPPARTHRPRLAATLVTTAHRL